MWLILAHLVTIRERVKCENSHFFINALLSFSSSACHLVVMPSVDTFENVMKLSAMIVQCLWENQSPLLQLPHLLPEQLKHFHTKKRNISSIEGFAALPKKQRRCVSIKLLKTGAPLMEWLVHGFKFM